MSYYAPIHTTIGGQTEIEAYDKVMSRNVKDSVYTERIEFKLDFWKYIDNPVYARLKNLY